MQKPWKTCVKMAEELASPSFAKASLQVNNATCGCPRRLGPQSVSGPPGPDAVGRRHDIASVSCWAQPQSYSIRNAHVPVKGRPELGAGIILVFAGVETLHSLNKCVHARGLLHAARQDAPRSGHTSPTHHGRRRSPELRTLQVQACASGASQSSPKHQHNRVRGR